MTFFASTARVRAVAAVAGLVVLATGVLVSPLGAALPGAERIAFKVLRDGAPLGHHTVTFRREAGDLHVTIDIELEVRLAFISLFHYRHRNHEVWRDGRLVSIDTETDDDGERFWLRGRAVEDGLQIEGSGGRLLAPAEIMPTSYWNPETVTRTRFLDTQRGRLIALGIAPAGDETVTVAGQDVETRRYRVTGDLTLDLWYTQDGEWAKIDFEARGAQIVYTRQSGSAKLADIAAPVSGQ